MSSRFNQPESIRELKRMIVRHRWRFILPFFAVTTIVLVVGLFIPRQYEATAIFERRNDLVLSEMAGRGAPQQLATLKTSLREELRGLPAIDRVIDDLGLIPRVTEDMPEEVRRAAELARGDLLQRIHRHVRLTFDISTEAVDRVRLIYTDTDPQRARQVVNELIRNYIADTRSEIDKMLTEAAEFFETEAQTCRDKINQMEEQRLAFEVKNAGLLPDDPNSVQEQLAGAEEKLVTLQRSFQTIESRIDRLKMEMNGGSATTASIVRGSNPEYQQLDEKVRSYEQQLEHALYTQKMTDRHPTVVALRRKLAALQEELEATPREVVTQRVYGESAKQTGLEMALLDAQAQRDAITEELAMTEKKVARLRAAGSQAFPVRAEHRRMMRDIAEVQRQMEFWEDRHRRVTMALTAELGQRGISLDFIKPASRITRPTSPDLMQILFASLVLGALAGVAAVLLADRSDQTLRSLEQAQRDLPVQVIGSVSEIISRQQAAVRRLVWRLMVPLGMTVMFMIMLGAAYMNYLSLRTPYAFGGQSAQTSLVEPVSHHPQAPAQPLASAHEQARD